MKLSTQHAIKALMILGLLVPASPTFASDCQPSNDPRAIPCGVLDQQTVDHLNEYASPDYIGIDHTHQQAIKDAENAEAEAQALRKQLKERYEFELSTEVRDATIRAAQHVGFMAGGVLLFIAGYIWRKPQQPQ